MMSSTRRPAQLPSALGLFWRMPFCFKWSLYGGFCCFFLGWMGAEVPGLAASRGGPAVSSQPQRNPHHKTLQQ